jgi:hypothetical protein
MTSGRDGGRTVSCNGEAAYPPDRHVGRGTAVGGQEDIHAAPVGGGLLPLDQAAAFKPLGQPGEPTGGHQAALGKFGHPHPLATRLTEQGQDAVLGHGDVERGNAGFELAPDPVMREQESTPGLIFQLAQPRCRHSRNATGCPGRDQPGGRAPRLRRRRGRPRAIVAGAWRSRPAHRARPWRTRHTSRPGPRRGSAC